MRRYDIAEGRLDEFVERWRNGVLPLRRSWGFTIVGAWSVPESSEFVWVLGHDTAASFHEADRTYYESSERRSMEPNPAELIDLSRKHPAVSVI